MRSNLHMLKWSHLNYILWRILINIYPLTTVTIKIQSILCWVHTLCLCVCVCVSCSVVSDSETPWTVAHQTPLSVEFSKQEHWSGLPFLSPGDLPNPGIEPGSSPLQADSLLSEPPGKPIKPITSKIPLVLLLSQFLSLSHTQGTHWSAFYHCTLCCPS